MLFFAQNGFRGLHMTAVAMAARVKTGLGTT